VGQGWFHARAIRTERETMTQVRTSPKPPHADYFPLPKGSGGVGHWVKTLENDHMQLLRYWPVVQNMVMQELRVRYQRSVMGFLWTLLNPILMMTTLTLVFSQILGMRKEGYAIYLFAGMVPWNFLNGSISESAFCIITNEGLIRKIYLPKWIFPLTRVMINLVTFLLSMSALFVILGPLGARPTLPMLMLPVVVLLFAAFGLGLSLLVATVNTFFRDCGHLVAVFLQAWYFLTPIIYQEKDLGAASARLWLNPAYPFIRMFHSIIHNGLWPDLTTFLVATGVASVSLGIGYVAFKSHEDKMVFRL
jgi:ABC-2 type transport system permease protein/lipopolysaccharide transport system permease protein